jgi:hypothetical protein
MKTSVWRFIEAVMQVRVNFIIAIQPLENTFTSFESLEID